MNNNTSGRIHFEQNIMKVFLHFHFAIFSALIMIQTSKHDNTRDDDDDVIMMALKKEPALMITLCR